MCCSRCYLVRFFVAIMLWLDWIWRGFQGLAVLFLLMVFQFFALVSKLSVIIALTAFFSYICELIWNRFAISSGQAIWTVVLIMALGEDTSMWLLQTTWYRLQARKHQIILGKLPSIIYHALYYLAFTQLYFQYTIAQTQSRENIPAVPEEGYDPGEELNKTATFVFLLSLCYMAYALVRSTAWARFVNGLDLEDPIPFDAYGVLCYIFLEAILATLYLIPVVLIGSLCQYYKFLPIVAFFWMNAIAYVIAAICVQIENACIVSPRPRNLGEMDFDETHICARHYLLYVIFPFIPLSYYCSEILHYSSFSAENNFYIFCLLVSLLTIQSTKAVGEWNWIQRKMRPGHMRLDDEEADILELIRDVPHPQVVVDLGPPPAARVHRPARVVPTPPVNNPVNIATGQGRDTPEPPEPERNQNHVIEVLKPISKPRIAQRHGLSKSDRHGHKHSHKRSKPRRNRAHVQDPNRNAGNDSSVSQVQPTDSIAQPDNTARTTESVVQAERGTRPTDNRTHTENTVVQSTDTNIQVETTESTPSQSETTSRTSHDGSI